MNKRNTRTNKKKINKRKVIILLIIILIILLIICLAVIKKLSQPKVENVPVTPANTEGWLGYKNKLSDVYEGTKDTLEISTKIKQVFEIYIPTMSEEILKLDSNEEITEFYNNHKEYINNRMCIKSEEEFKKIVTELISLEVDLKTLEYCIYLEGSYEGNSTYEKVTFMVYYTDEKKIALNALITGTYGDMGLELQLY